MLAVTSSAFERGPLWLSVPTPDQDGFGGVARMSQISVNVNQFSSGPLNFWAEAAELTAKRPLFGYGVNQFQYTSQIADGRFRHPHNFVMQVFFDWGIVDGSAFLGLFAFAVAGMSPTARIGNAVLPDRSNRVHYDGRPRGN